MKTKKKTFFYLMIAMLLCAAMLPSGSVTVSAQSTAQKAKAAKKAYAKIVKNAKREFSSVHYAYVDINGDKIPELLMSRPEEDSRLYTWNASKNKAKRLKISANGKWNCGITYWKKKHQVCFRHADTGGSDYTVYSYKGKKFKKLYTIRFNNGKYEDGSYYNGIRSEKKAKKKLNLIEKNFKELTKYI